jgi:hypothetical protein
MNPDHDIIIVDITSEMLVWLLRLNAGFFHYPISFKSIIMYKNIDLYINISIYAYKIFSVLCLVLLLAGICFLNINVIYIDSK